MQLIRQHSICVMLQASHPQQCSDRLCSLSLQDTAAFMCYNQPTALEIGFQKWCEEVERKREAEAASQVPLLPSRFPCARTLLGAAETCIAIMFQALGC